MLRTVVVVDYQNVHLTGHHQFEATRSLPRHETVVDPSLYAARLVQVRNAHQRPGHDLAELHRVLVYRGHPSSRHDPAPYARNLAQKSHWERDPRVHVTLRPLKYEYVRDVAGRAVVGADGRRVPTGHKQEKGIDVLCALALVRCARDPDVDLVVLASTDSDLAPALDEALALGAAKIETASWFDATAGHGQQLNPTVGRVWNTRLGEADLQAVRDPTPYR